MSGLRTISAFVGVSALAAATLPSGCASSVVDDLADDPSRYIDDVAYRRGILERDLTERDNAYARARLSLYGIEDEGWEALPEVDRPSWALRASALEDLERGGQLTVDRSHATTLSPSTIPTDDAMWVALGRRVFFEYPLRADPVYEALARVPDAIEDVGFLVDDGALVGLRVFEDEDGRARIGPTCAQCHASRDPSGEVTGVLSNRKMNIGEARLRADAVGESSLSPEIESTAPEDLGRLGPGRSDVQADGVFNPYALPDFGGIADAHYLHHNANWFNRGVATLAVRCETLFITSNGAHARIPRVLTWALAKYFRSLPAPAPLDVPPAPEAARGRRVFDAAGCASCHTPPLYTSARRIPLDVIGTDRATGDSFSRHTGFMRIPSLRGIGRAAPYLHHGAIRDLEEMFDPNRTEPGHAFGLDLSADDRKALIAFLRSI